MCVCVCSRAFACKRENVSVCVREKIFGAQRCIINRGNYRLLEQKERVEASKSSFFITFIHLSSD